MPILGEHAGTPAPALADGALPDALEELVDAPQPALRRGRFVQLSLSPIRRGSRGGRRICRLSGRSARPSVGDSPATLLPVGARPRPHLCSLSLDRVYRPGGIHPPALSPA